MGVRQVHSIEISLISLVIDNKENHGVGDYYFWSINANQLNTKRNLVRALTAGLYIFLYKKCSSCSEDDTCQKMKQDITDILEIAYQIDSPEDQNMEEKDGTNAEEKVNEISDSLEQFIEKYRQ